VLAEKSDEMPTGPNLTLELGLGIHTWIAEWCEEAERRLAAGAGDAD
jgi:hypothetical protein